MACLVSLLPGKIPKGEKASMKNEYCYDEKKIFLVILALIFSLTACGEKKEACAWDAGKE